MTEDLATPSTSTTDLELRARALDALRTFIDPCSEGVGKPINVVDLGLIERVDIDESGAVRVEFCPTGPSCFFQISMMQEIESRVAHATDRACSVQISDEVWDPDRIHNPARDSSSRWSLPISPSSRANSAAS